MAKIEAMCSSDGKGTVNCYGTAKEVLPLFSAITDNVYGAFIKSGMAKTMAVDLLTAAFVVGLEKASGKNHVEITIDAKELKRQLEELRNKGE